VYIENGRFVFHTRNKCFFDLKPKNVLSLSKQASERTEQMERDVGAVIAKAENIKYEMTIPHTLRSRV
jgi:hypothetical protein